MSGMMPPGMFDKLLLDQLVSGQGPGPNDYEQEKLDAMLLADANSPKYPAAPRLPMNDSEVIPVDDSLNTQIPSSGSSGGIIEKIIKGADNAIGYVTKGMQEGANMVKRANARINEDSHGNNVPEMLRRVQPAQQPSQVATPTSQQVAQEVKAEISPYGDSVVLDESMPESLPAPDANQITGDSETGGRAADIIESALSDLDSDLASKKEAREQYGNFLNAQSAEIIRQIKSPEQLSTDQNFFEARMAEKEADMQNIIDGLKENANKKDHWGVTLGKALAVGLGAYGAAMTGTPNFAAQIIESAADRAAKALALNAEKSLKLLGFKKQDIEDFKTRYDSGLKQQQGFKDALMQIQIEKIKSVISDNSSTANSKERTNAAKVLSQLEVDRNKVAKESQGKGVVMKEVINMPQAFFNNLDPKQKELVNEITVGSKGLLNSYTQIMEIIDNKDFFGISGPTQRADLEPLLNQLATNIRLASGMGVLNKSDEKYVEQQRALVGFIEKAIGAGKSEFISRILAPLSQGQSILKGFDESFDFQPGVLRAIEQMKSFRPKKGL